MYLKKFSCDQRAINATACEAASPRKFVLTTETWWPSLASLRTSRTHKPGRLPTGGGVPGASSETGERREGADEAG